MSDSANLLSADQLLERAIELRRQDQREQAYAYLRAYLLREHALLRLARLSTAPAEARSAAQLALSLAPSDELAQRVLVDVEQRFADMSDQPPAREQWPAIIALTTGMTLAQARMINWPFNGINRPIGAILDDGTRSLKDILWACDNADDTRIRDAARTILLSHLLDAAPEQPPKPLAIITGSRYSERQERRALVFAGAAAGVALLLTLILVVSATLLLILGSSLPIALAMYGLMAITLIAFRFFERRAQRATSFKLGRWGEERVVEALRSALDGRWTLIRNFTWPGRNDGDIDLVLVGPGGVWAFEVKAYSGTIRNIGDTWERKINGSWRRLPVRPGAQARTNAANLKAFLDAQGIAVGWVQAVVIWAGGEATHPDDRGSLIVDQPKTPVWQSAEISDRVVDLWQNRRGLEDQTITAVVELLRRTVQQAEPGRPAQASQSAVSTNRTP